MGTSWSEREKIIKALMYNSGCVWLVFFCLAGCAPVKFDKLPAKNIKVWNIPPEGRKVPGPRSIMVARNGEVIVLDELGRVLVFNPQGELQRRWWMPEYELGRPEGLVELKDGRIAVSDTHYHRVVIFNRDGTVARIFGVKGTEPGHINNPVGITQDDEGFLYICEYGVNNRIQKFTLKGKSVMTFGKTGVAEGELQRPASICWRNNMLYVVDAVNNRIQVFSEQGVLLKVFGAEKKSKPQFYLPYDIAFAPDGRVYVIEYGNSRITELSPAGQVVGHFGKPGIKHGEFKTPWGIAVGADGTVYVADTGNRRIVVLNF